MQAQSRGRLLSQQVKVIKLCNLLQPDEEISRDGCFQRSGQDLLDLMHEGACRRSRHLIGEMQILNKGMFDCLEIVLRIVTLVFSGQLRTEDKGAQRIQTASLQRISHRDIEVFDDTRRLGEQWNQMIGIGNNHNGLVRILDFFENLPDLPHLRMAVKGRIKVRMKFRNPRRLTLADRMRECL